jgi:hypothetical protein
MAAIFQIRRGSGSVSLVDGELYLHKGSGSLQFSLGDGNPILLARLDQINSGSLRLSGDVTASNAYFSGDVAISGNLFLGNQTSDTITATGEFTSNLIPNPTDTYNLGSDTKRWGRMFINSISASAFTGSLYGMGDPTSFSTSVDLRLDRVEASASLYDNAMSGSNRLYVSPSGSDSNDGKDPSTPFRTIKAAVESLYPIEPSNPFSSRRYTIFVGSGNYTEQNPIVVPPGVAIVGDTLRTVRLTATNPTKDFFHTHDSNYFYGLRFLDLKYPAFAFSFPSSIATGSISAGGVSSIGVVHSMAGYTNGNNQNLGIVIEGPDASGSIATATANVVGGVITQINVVNAGTNYASGEKPHISIPAPSGQRPVITTSPYVQNCSSITGPFNTSGVKVLQALPYSETTFNIDEQGAGGGIRIDGNLVDVSSPLESFVADAFTQVNQGGPGHLVINKGYAQFVSCFTTFCTYGFKVANGGFANISNSVIDFGAKGLVSKTYFPQTYNTGSSLQTLTSTVVGAVIQQDGAGYTGSVATVTISGGGASVQATAEANVNANGSIDQIIILTPGSGYTSQPTLTIAAPTGASPIQATTIGGKAQISGIAAILFQLESGSRGIDVSSNMILSGTDYLVTNVATGSSANQRYVTVYPAPPSITTGNSVYFHQLSNISTGGLVMEYVGSGVTYNALPKFGGVPNRNREIVEYAPGRVFYSTVDNIGNLKIGDFFAVNQLTGEVTIDANQFNLSGLSAIGPFKRNGVGVGVILNEVSNNTTLLNSQGITGEDTVPTQFAVKGYIDIRDGRLNNLETTSASLNIATSSLNTYTASLKTAIDVTGGNTRILGNLIVDGTQTSLNTTETFIEDKSITLASGSTTSGIADGAGLNIAGANVSMSWEDSNQRLYFNTNIAASGSISSSTIIGLNGVSVTTYSTSVDSRIVSLSNTSTTSTTRLSRIEESTASLNTFSASVLGHITDINTKTGSFETKWSSLLTTTASLSASLHEHDVYTASVAGTNQFTASTLTRLSRIEESTGSLNSYTGSNDTTNTTQNARLTSLETFTGSQNTKNSTLESVTSSLNLSTASFNIWTGSTFNTFSQSVDTRLDSVEYITSLLGGGLEVSLLQINAATASLQAATSSYETKGRGLVSGSSQLGNYVATIVGTSNQVLVAGSGVNNAAITLSTPQDIATTSNVTFNNITASAGIRAVGDIIAYYSSDERLKENITPIENALSKVELISGNTYDWKEGFENIHPHKGNDVGVIAQEIEKVLPQVVVNRENGYKAVDYEKIIPLLIESIKELSAKVKELENK